MKFLIALSFLISASAFADLANKEIKCYETTQHGGHRRIAYILEARGGMIYLSYPDNLQAPLKLNYEGCLARPNGGGTIGGTNGGISGISSIPRYSLELCPTRGQEIQGLISFKASVGQDEETVYCEKSIRDLFKANI